MLTELENAFDGIAEAKKHAARNGSVQLPLRKQSAISA